MLSSKTITIDKGRDKGKQYKITEMPVAKADNWCMRALFAIGGSLSQTDVVSASNMMQTNPQAGVMAIAQITTEALSKIDPNVGIPLLNELLECVEVITSSNATRPLDLNLGDVQDVLTLLKLRGEVLKLHADFFMPALGLTSASAQAAQTP